MPRLGRLMVVMLLAGSAGCGLVDELGMGHKAPPKPVAPAVPFESKLTLDYLSLLRRLVQSSPAEQAEIAGMARRAADIEPTVSNRLRYALVLALPGHPASDPAAARAALGSLLAAPAQMLPAEQALASVMLQDVNARMALLSENQRLADEAERQDKERLQALNRRVQAQAAENTRLREQLNEALAKLEAVANLERSMAEKQVAPKGQKP